MKIFLSALETSYTQASIQDLDQLLYNLVSFYYIKQPVFEAICRKSKLMMIDSGAHSFQKGIKVDWREYTDRYARWIKQNDRPNVVGYFEMDVDNIIGYSNVLQLRKRLMRVTDKIIPVWHKNRGLDEYKRMCSEFAGKVIAITGFKNEDIRDDQYLMFLRYAKQFNCRVHCLGMTRPKVLDKVPFDYVDSSSWRQGAIFGRIDGRKVDKQFSRNNWDLVFREAYKAGMRMQQYYEEKWRKYE